jgi:N-acyl-phosphatidylethanolamine-hydrolysing phospholipase D
MVEYQLSLFFLLYGKRFLAAVVTGLLYIFTLQSCTAAETYTNSDPSVSPKTLSDAIEWRIIKAQKPDRLAITVSDEWKSLAPQSTHYAVWIGHATYLLNTGDLTVLTDPVFSERASPVSWAGPERLIPPVISLEQLPSIDAVVISHNHYDHLDIPSLKTLQKNNPNMLIFVPQGDKKLLDAEGLTNVSQFRWWQSIKVNKTEFTFTPVQHWSGRGITGKNTSLWGGWFLKSPSLSVYHAGDTGYSNDFVVTQERLGTPDFDVIPNGGYEPRSYMKNKHVNPAEAVQIALDLQVKRSFGMHWGTFVLTDEPIEEPRKMLVQALKERNLAPNFFIAPAPGAILSLAR